MNPLAVFVLVVGSAVAVGALARKRNPVVQWLTDFWAGRVQPPAEFVRRMTDGCTWLVEGGELAPVNGDGLDVHPNPGSDIRAVTDCVVSWVGTIPGRGPALGLSSLHQSDESFLYVGIDYMVGLGGFVAGDQVIGQARQGTYGSNETLFTFAVQNTMAADPNSGARPINARAWLRENGTQATAFVRGWV
ncbi:MAG: hypothetical protein M0R22_00430 [Dehalococcoidia bacterium]|nr:hypothetical protein [Dehalococcoidia bacterium]